MSKTMQPKTKEEHKQDTDSIEYQIDSALDYLKMRGMSKIDLLEKIRHIPILIDKLRFLRRLQYNDDILLDGLFIKPITECHCICYKPWLYGCNRNISQAISDRVNCKYFGI